MSAMRGPLMQRGVNGAAARLVEQRKLLWSGTRGRRIRRSASRYRRAGARATARSRWSMVTICVVPRYSAPNTAPRSGLASSISTASGRTPSSKLALGAGTSRKRGAATFALPRCTSVAPASSAIREGQQIHRRRADEIGDEHARRPIVDLTRRSDLLDHAAIHHCDVIGHRHRLELIVGDVDGRRIEAGRARRAARRVIMWRSSESSAPSGSSIRKAFGLRTMARPSATRWRSPEDRPDDRAIEQMLDLQNARRLRDARHRLRPRPCPAHFSGKAMFWRTFICG